MTSATRKRYTSEFKAQAVGLVGLGKPVSEVAEDLGIGSSILYGWVRRTPQPGQPAADELPRLRREIATLKLENDILKKAAVILGTRTWPTPAR